MFNVVGVFTRSCADRQEVASPYGFDLHFPMTSDVHFSCAYWLLIHRLVRFCPLLIRWLSFLLLNHRGCFYTPNTVLSQLYVLTTFSSYLPLA